MSELRLGKRPATPDRRDLLFANYRESPIGLPKTFGYGHLVKDWQMLGNGPDPQMPASFKGAGDCYWAGTAHQVMVWAAAAGAKVPTFKTVDVLAAYASTGYDPRTGAGDNGTDVRKGLGYVQKTGLVDASGVRHKIGAYVALEPGNLTQLREALYLFGAVGIGIQFPSYAEDQFAAGKSWSYRSGGSIEGGHYIPVVLNPLQVVTWGQLQKMTASFYSHLCDEAWAIISPDFLHNGKSPAGFDLAQLTADLKTVTG